MITAFGATIILFGFVPANFDHQLVVFNRAEQESKDILPFQKHGVGNESAAISDMDVNLAGVNIDRDKSLCHLYLVFGLMRHVDSNISLMSAAGKGIVYNQYSVQGSCQRRGLCNTHAKAKLLKTKDKNIFLNCKSL